MLAAKVWQTQFDERLPIYEQIVQRFCRSLVKGELLPSERIPSIRDLALELKVNQNTIQRAYQELERREIIFSKRGTGYFITEDLAMSEKIKREMLRDAMMMFLYEMRSLGFEDTVTVEELRNYLKEGASDNASA